MEASGPFGEAIDIRKDCQLALSQNGELLLVDLLLASGGQPKVFRHQAGADDSGLLGLHQSDWLVRIFGQQMFPKQALREFPVFREHSGAFHHGVNTVDATGFAFVLNAVASLRIIEHHLAGAAPSFCVNLEEDDDPAVSDADAVFIDKALNDDGIKDGFQELDEVGFAAVADGAGYDVRRNDAQRPRRLRCRRLV